MVEISWPQGNQAVNGENKCRLAVSGKTSLLNSKVIKHPLWIVGIGPQPFLPPVETIGQENILSPSVVATAGSQEACPGEKPEHPVSQSLTEKSEHE